MSVGTLADAFGLDWKIHMRCLDDRMRGMKHGRECGYRTELDLKTLVATRGRDFPLARLAERLRGPKCGCREVSVLFGPPSGQRTAFVRLGRGTESTSRYCRLGI